MMWDVERGHEIPTRDMIHDDVKQADYGTDYHNQSQNLQKRYMDKSVTEAILISVPEFFQNYVECAEDGSITGNANGTYMKFLWDNKINCSMKSMITDFFTFVTPTTWWRSILACPISQIDFSSGLLQNRRVAVMETRDIFGEEGIDYIVVDGLVYFKKKKMAQKSAVLKALYHFQVCQDTNENDNYPRSQVPIKEKSRRADSQETNNLSDINDSKRRPFPLYVRQLHSLGIRSSGIKILFWTKKETREEYLSRKYLCRNYPSLIFCKITIFSPVELSVTTSCPAESKSAAFKLAVGRIADNVQVPQPDTGTDSQESSLAMEAIMRVYHEAVITQCDYPPSGAIGDIFEQGCDGFCELYLYTLEIPFLNGFGSSQFGLLFQSKSKDESFHSSEDIKVAIPLGKGQDSVSEVLLKNQTMVKISLESLNSLAKLNIILHDKNYGRSNKAKVSGPHSFDCYKQYIDIAKQSMKDLCRERTYLLTPMNTQKQCIDWELVSRILDNDLQSFACWQSARSTTANLQHKEMILAFQPTSAQLYIVETSQRQQDITAFSTFPNEEYDSYYTYYEKKHSIKLDRPDLPLIPARRVISLNKELDASINCTKDGVEEDSFLAQEMIIVFPLPWNLIMTYKLLPLFALPIERILELRKMSHQLSGLSLNPTMCSSFLSLDRIEEATSVFPCSAYERLEHIGDTVLGFFVAINYFAHNSSMQWDDEDLGEHKAAAVRNKALKRSGLSCGVDKLIWQGHNSWISAFKDTINKSSLQKPKAICYNQIPDIVESLLGAAFLCEHKLFSSKHQYTVIGFLDQLRLPMHVDCVGDERNRWFKHPHACIGGGFDFNTNEAWRKQFEQILETFHSEVYIKQRLSTGVDNLLSLFRGLNPSAELRLCADMKMVMACALFNDSLESDSDDSLQGNPPILLARFRKNLFFIGEAALHLALAMECHRRYPLASASDLHLLKVCCIADDAISYIVMKAGIHHFLYDQESDHRQVQSFKVMVDEADKNGRKAWDRCHGWVLGRGEFAKRWKRRWWANGDGGDPPSLPRYAGLGGGCLYGQDRKVGELVYKQLVYSFKSIIGSMVIAVGLDNMWNIAVSLFEEILLLSPEETRACYKNSITSTYSPGKKSQSVQRANSLKARYGTGWSGVT